MKSWEPSVRLIGFAGWGDDGEIVVNSVDGKLTKVKSKLEVFIVESFERAVRIRVLGLLARVWDRRI